MPTGQRKGRRSALRRSQLAVLSSLGALFAAVLLSEALLAIFWPQRLSSIAYDVDPVFGVQRAPCLRGRDRWPGVYDYRFQTNSLGMRGDRELVEGRVSKKRLLLLGDSFTFGIGVDDGETFAARLQEELDRERPGIWEVINAGQPGKGTDYALLFFETRGKLFFPELTILCFNPTDYFDNEKGEYFSIQDDGTLVPRDVLKNIPDTTKRLLRYRPLYAWFLDNFHVGGLIKAAVRTQVVVASSPAGFLPHADLAKTLGPTESYLATLRKRTAEAGSGLDILYVPFLDAVERFKSTGEVLAEERASIELAERLDIPLVSTTGALAESPRCCRPLYFREGHWSEEGHRIAARVLFDLVTAGSW